jgi:hypothetical protein
MILLLSEKELRLRHLVMFRKYSCLHGGNYLSRFHVGTDLTRKLGVS